jgi:hypothetical protein
MILYRAFRGHLVRKRAIYKRPALSTESIEWARQFKAQQLQSERTRQIKAFETAEQ